MISRKRTRIQRNYAQNIRQIKRNSGKEFETKEFQFRRKIYVQKNL